MVVDCGTRQQRHNEREWLEGAWKCDNKCNNQPNETRGSTQGRGVTRGGGDTTIGGRAARCTGEYAGGQRTLATSGSMGEEAQAASRQKAEVPENRIQRQQWVDGRDGSTPTHSAAAAHEAIAGQRRRYINECATGK